jgi:hypothetical protein
MALRYGVSFSQSASLVSLYKREAFVNRDYTQLFERIVAAKGEWLEVDGAQLAGSTAVARQKALSRAATQRKYKIQTRLREGRLSARLAEEGKMRDVLERIGRRRPMNKRVPLKRIYGGKWFRIKDDKASCVTAARVMRWSCGLYLLSPDVEVPPEHQRSVNLVNIYTAITSRNQYFLLYIFMNGGQWCRSAVVAARAAMSAWVKVEKDRRANYVAVGGCLRTSEPDWEKLPSFDAMLASAFRGRIIDNAGHPVFRQLLGFEPAESFLT